MNDVSGPYIFWIENFLERNQPSAHKLFNNLEIFDVAISQIILHGSYSEYETKQSSEL
jgi:hypothetical protein